MTRSVLQRSSVEFERRRKAPHHDPLRTTIVAVWLVGCLLALPAHGADAWRWYRGNTHTHTLWSDGDQFPELVAEWYKTNNYDFLVLSDHNTLSRGEKWKDITKPERAWHIVDKLRRRFGEDAVETRHEADKLLAKLRTLDEVEALICEPGRFILIEGEEITGRCGDRHTHGNAINISEVIKPAPGDDVALKLSAYADDVHAQGIANGCPVFMHINHPNWQYSHTAEEVAGAGHADGVEIINPDTSNLGDAIHPSVERMWDIANALRIRVHGLPPLWCVASDDAHRYHEFSDRNSNPGRAWIMVRSRELTADAITQAMRDGDFYATTGVLLDEVAYDAAAGTLSVTVRAEPGVRYRIEFIGTARDADLTAGTPPDPPPVKGKPGNPVSGVYGDRIGAVLEGMDASHAVYKLTGNELYVRARVTDLTTPPTTWGGETIPRRAWTQPVGW